MTAEGRRLLSLGLFVILGLFTPGIVGAWMGSAADRLEASESYDDEGPQVAVAAHADEGYCNARLKKVLRRVLASCGLLGSGESRGCQPLEAKNVAALSGGDFNDLFLPLADRAGIIQFGQDDDVLDPSDERLLDTVFTDQRGASYFFVVARSSPEGNAVYNQQLSQRRGDSVLGHLRQTFDDPDLDKEVGLLWLGEEFAQLDESFCDWNRSGDECSPADLNRSAFVAWIDCQL